MTARDPLDRYYTPDALAEACLLAMAPASWRLLPARVIEPYAGGGAYLRAARRLWPGVYVMGCDVDPDAPALAPGAGLHVTRCPTADYTPLPDGLTWVVSNPPYRDVYETVAEARGLMRRCVADRLGLLLRATALSRLMVSDDPPAHVYIARQRPRWGGPGGAGLRSGDSVDAVWCVWEAGPVDCATLRGLDWRASGRASTGGAR
jgi:hypothetical protein